MTYINRAKKFLRYLPFIYIILFLSYLLFSIPGFISLDSYFHARYSSRLPQNMFSSEFPQTRYSVWNKSWGDKEFLFHIYLMPFCQSEDNIIVFSKIAGLILASLSILMIFLILKKLNAAYPSLAVLLLLISSDYWLGRMAMLRPHLLSLLFILAVFYFFMSGRNRPIYVLLFLYTWSYSAPYFAFLMLLLMCSGELLYYMQNRKEDINKYIKSRAAFISISALATAAGFFMHPHTPRVQKTFFTHVSLLFTKLWASGSYIMTLADELKSQTMKDFIVYNPGIILILTGIWLMLLLKKRRAGLKLFVTLWLLPFLILLNSFSQRFITYLVPFSVMAFTLFVPNLDDYFKSRKMKRLFLSAAAGVFVLLHMNIINKSALSLKNVYSAKSSKAAAIWIRNNISPDDLIIPLNWSQFPELYFYAPDNTYVVGMEPMLMHVLYPEKLKYLEQARLNIKALTRKDMKQFFPDAKYLIISKKFNPDLFGKMASVEDSVIYKDNTDLILSVD